MTQQLWAALGHKPIFVSQLSPLMTLGSLAQALVVCTAWLALLGVFLTAARARLGFLLSLMHALATVVVLVLVAMPSGKPRGRRHEPRRAPPAPAVSGTNPSLPRRPLVFVGVDGVDGTLLRRAIQAEALPHLRELVERGFTTQLDNDGYGFSPVVWTTIATGKTPEEHGIHDFVTQSSPLFAGPLEPLNRHIPPAFGVKRVLVGLKQMDLVRGRFTNGRDRRVPSVWQILSAYGRTTLTANYLGTYPAEMVEGAFLAPGLFHLVGHGGIDPLQGLNGYEFPAGLVRDLGIVPSKVSASAADVIESGEEEFDYVAELVLASVREHRFDLVTVYTHWTDTFNHVLRLEELAAMKGGRFEGEVPARLLGAYRKLDVFVGRIRAALPDANLLLMSDHGVSNGFLMRKSIVQHTLDCPGIFIAFGPDARTGGGRPVSMYDVAPTILSYFGVPVGEDMPGAPIEALDTSPVRQRIASHDTKVANRRVESSGSEIAGLGERLRALGYIQ